MHIIVKADLHILYMYAECLVRVLYLPFRLYSPPPPPSLSLSANAKGRKLEEQGDLGGSCAALLQASNTKGRTVREHPLLSLTSICSRFLFLLICLFSLFSLFSPLYQICFPCFLHSYIHVLAPFLHTHTLHSPSQCMSRAMDQS